MSWELDDPGAGAGVDPAADVDLTDYLDPASPINLTDHMLLGAPVGQPAVAVPHEDSGAAAPALDPAVGGIPDLPNFHPGQSDPTAVTGNPGEAMEVWRPHTGENACAIGAQGMVLTYLTGQEFSEQQLTQEAASMGWFDGSGTAPDDVGNLLEYHGVPVEHVEGATLEQLEEVVASGGAAIVGLDSSEIWTPGFDPADDPVGGVPGIPGQGADHAVWVTGFDHSDPANPMVILNDSGHPDGQGLEVPLDEFLGAWQDSGNLLVAAGSPGVVPA
ncbi:C39 family peptidase [Streptomyces sp. 5-8]|uniref:C39 family peptidase n=1 Tax=Streptomyces musisoli TaxID=2802280 RepID=A0ABS1P2M4_9ACTN|nr:MULTISPECIES: C39 family peptidase [Streptomyces]MBL1106622.1 C39 family peptidase [Streptomyces musisoli]MBY8840582.1 C39 family peptidase [Streptomyces sp. SP2-10]